MGLRNTKHVIFGVVEQMSDKEMETLNGILQKVGAGRFAGLRLNRNMKRDDYTWVLV